MTTNGTTTLDGRVADVNDRGIKLGGTKQWLNFSRFTAVPRPERGQTVRVEVGGDGFIRKLQVLGGNTEASAPGSNAGSAAAPDQRSVRLRVLEIAASTTVGFAGCNEPGKIRSTDILPLADKLLAWVLEQPARHTIEDLEP
jgi:hypothetical protein